MCGYIDIARQTVDGECIGGNSVQIPVFVRELSRRRGVFVLFLRKDVVADIQMGFVQDITIKNSVGYNGCWWCVVNRERSYVGSVADVALTCTCIHGP